MLFKNTGKPRSKFGKFLDDNGISQGELAKEAGVNKDTVTKACSTSGDLRGVSKGKLIKAAKKLSNKPIYEDDFWT